jgi:hypothetical protein
MESACELVDLSRRASTTNSGATYGHGRNVEFFGVDHELRISAERDDLKSVVSASTSSAGRNPRGLRRPNGVAVGAEHVNLPAATDDERIPESSGAR